MIVVGLGTVVWILDGMDVTVVSLVAGRLAETSEDIAEPLSA